MKRLLIYMGRWQLSTPILTEISKAIHYFFGINSFLILLTIANVFGALIFYRPDKWILNRKHREQDE
jgi:hypothetical protein